MAFRSESRTRSHRLERVQCGTLPDGGRKSRQFREQHDIPARPTRLQLDKPGGINAGSTGELMPNRSTPSRGQRSAAEPEELHRPGVSEHACGEQRHVPRGRCIEQAGHLLLDPACQARLGWPRESPASKDLNESMLPAMRTRRCTRCLPSAPSSMRRSPVLSGSWASRAACRMSDLCLRVASRDTFTPDQIRRRRFPNAGDPAICTGSSPSRPERLASRHQTESDEMRVPTDGNRSQVFQMVPKPPHDAPSRPRPRSLTHPLVIMIAMGPGCWPSRAVAARQRQGVDESNTGTRPFRPSGHP